METPKLLWLRGRRPQVFDAAWQFFDLADFLTWRATGDLARSTCTVTCKWTYLAHEKRWDATYFHEIGLGALADEGFARIGQSIVEPGSPLGQGLTAAAAGELGLVPGTAVAAGLIDAHAGGIGTVGIGAGPRANLGYVFGTSSCTMTSTVEPAFVPGVWGPYYSAMVPGMWLNEGGQSAAGAAIEQLLSFHPAASEAKELSKRSGVPLPVLLADMAAQKAGYSSDAVKTRRRPACRSRIPRQSRALRRSARPRGDCRSRHGEGSRQSGLALCRRPLRHRLWPETDHRHAG